MLKSPLSANCRCPLTNSRLARGASRLAGWRRAGLRTLIALALPAGVALAAAAGDGRELADLSLEELMSLEVTSVSKKSEALFDTAAAVHVLTGDDLKRSGATSIPEALRLVPGISVAQIDANKWAITARGLNGRFANKLLVLIDGRTAYSPFFGGVFWDTQSVVLEDVERIEIIRGPGGTLWGANAVNGVINIITRRTEDTQGTLLVSRAGDYERASGALRHGGELGERGHYRVSLEARQHDERTGIAGLEGNDDWSMARAAFRADLESAAGGRWMLDAALYNADYGGNAIIYEDYPTLFDFGEAKGDASGGHALAEWQGTLGAGTEASLRAFYDLQRRDETIFAETRHTGDAELQLRHELGGRHELVWGIGARLSRGIYESTETIRATLDKRTDRRWNAFLQDEVALIPGELSLIIGSKFEHNSYTGFEVQPSIRLSWNPTPERIVWTALSRAVRTPSFAISFVELDAPVSFNPAFPASIRLLGNSELDSETVLAAEAGFRAKLSERLLVDIAAFHNTYDDIALIVAEEPFAEFDPPPPHLVFPIRAQNAGELETWGAELSIDTRINDDWRLVAGYSYFDQKLDTDMSFDFTVNLITLGDPKHQAFLRASGTWDSGLEFDAIVRFVDELEGLGVGAYTTADLRVAYRVHDRIELSLVGRNLVDEDRVEFFDILAGTPATLVPRSFHGSVTWRF